MAVVLWEIALVHVGIKAVYGVIRLFQIAQMPIKRDVKIMSQATPFDPFWEGFLNERKVKNTGRNSWFEPVATAL